MTTIWKNTLKCIAVLAVVALVSGVMVLGLNALLPAKTSFFDKNKLKSICPAEDYYQLNQDDLAGFDISLSEFNAPYQTSSVRAVFRAVGGENDGNYIIEAEGLGYSDKYPIILYVSYNDNGEILGVVDLQVDKGNTFWSQLKPYLDEVYDGLVGKSGDIGGPNDVVSAKTGATESLSGITRAVNIANTFIFRLIGGDDEAQEVTDQTLLGLLRSITSAEAEFVSYPFRVIDTVIGVTAEVTNVYVSDADDVIFETKSDAGTYGQATLLVSVDMTEQSVIAICPLALSVRDSERRGIETEFLDDAEVLTEMFAGSTVDDINGLPQYLQGTTGATQTADGIKSAILIALQSIDSFKENFFAARVNSLLVRAGEVCDE